MTARAVQGAVEKDLPFARGRTKMRGITAAPTLA